MKSIIFVKLSYIDYVNLARERGIELAKQTIAIPKFQKDKDIWNAVKIGDFKAKVSQPRNLKKHNLYFSLLEKVTDNGFLDRLPFADMKSAYNINITEWLVKGLRVRFKEDQEVVRYITKYLLLPLKQVITLAGTEYYEVSSQSFEEMDEIIFDDFFKRSVELWRYVLGITEEKLMKGDL